MLSTNIEQGSAEWIAVRLGKATASRIADVVARTKTGWGASRANYMAELIAERLTGQAAQSFTSSAMAWGTEHEPDARAAYCFFADADVSQVGFVEHPSIKMAGASPDGLVGDDGLIEIKAPNTSTHIETLLGQSVPSKYVTQMNWQMACTGRLYCDFVSFDPRLPDTMRLFVKRIARDNDLIASLEKDVADFLAETAKKVADLRALYEPTEAVAA